MASAGKTTAPLSEPGKGSLRKFSFLVDQDYERSKDEAAAAAAAKVTYKAGALDYLLFIYFCINVLVIGTPLLNSNAIVKAWQKTQTFVSECAPNEISEWCPEQAHCSKIALLLFQSALAATALMGGVLVDTASASMCFFLAHIMYGGGAYFFRESSTRGIYLGCVLQGIGGELLLNSVSPICGLFESKQNIMLLILTLFNNLSVLLYPVLLTFVAPDTPTASVQEEFYVKIQSYTIWFSMIAAIIGSFILPVDDDGNLIPIRTASLLTSYNKKPAGTLAKSHQLYSHHHSYDEESDDQDLESGYQSDDEETRASLLQLERFKSKTERHRTPKVLSNLRLTKKLRTIQFAIAVIIFSVSVFRNSFYLNNNRNLSETLGDNGTLADSLMWILALNCIFGPASWHINDNWDQLSSLSLFCFLSLFVNILIATHSASLQWLTMIIFVASQSSLASTMITYIANVFGFNHFPIISVIVGLIGAFFNFLNVILDRHTSTYLQSDYTSANYLMIGFGILSFLCVLCQYLFPTAKEVRQQEEENSSPPTSRQASVHYSALGGGEGNRRRPTTTHYSNYPSENITTTTIKKGARGGAAAVTSEEWEDEWEDE